MTYYIHVNRQTIAQNKKYGTNKPAVRFQKGKYGKGVYANRIKFTSGEVLYKPDGDPILPCGARLVIVTEEEPTVIE